MNFHFINFLFIYLFYFIYLFIYLSIHFLFCIIILFILFILFCHKNRASIRVLLFKFSCRVPLLGMSDW